MSFVVFPKSYHVYVSRDVDLDVGIISDFKQEHNIKEMYSVLRGSSRRVCVCVC